MITATVKHELKLDETRSRKLGPGVREKRHFFCTCGGFTVFGYDNRITAEFRAHKKAEAAR